MNQYHNHSGPSSVQLYEIRNLVKKDPTVRTGQDILRIAQQEWGLEGSLVRKASGKVFDLNLYTKDPVARMVYSNITDTLSDGYASVYISELYYRPKVDM